MQVTTKGRRENCHESKGYHKSNEAEFVKGSKTSQSLGT